MRVTSNTFPDNLRSHLQRLTSRMSQLQEQTATGQRITNPSDDPAAAVRVLDYQAERSKIAQYYRNAMRAQDIVTATTAEVRNLVEVSDRANEIVSLTSDMLGTDTVRTYAIEIDAMLEQAVVNANANFNGEPLFGGIGSETRPFQITGRDSAGRITGISYVGADTTAEFDVAEGTRISPYASNADSQDVLAFLNHLVELRNALDTGDAATVHDQATNLRSSEDALITMLSAQGGLQQRLEVEAAQSSERYTNLDTQISREADVDLAQAIVQLTQNQNAYQAALMSAGKILQQSLLDYID